VIAAKNASIEKQHVTERKLHLMSRRIYLCAVCLAIFASPMVARAEKAAPKKVKPVSEGPIDWYDCKELGVEGKGWTDTPSYYNRLPARVQGKTSPTVWNLGHNSAGLCVRFTTDAPSIEVRWTVLSSQLGSQHMAATGVSGVDFYVKLKDGRWQFAGNGRPDHMTNSVHFEAPPGQQYLLYLPLYNNVKSIEIGVPKGRTISACAASPRKPIVIYGTSITQGGCASRPGTAWTAIVGRRLDVPIINLGFSGGGIMEPQMADLLSELDPSIYVLDCITNMSPQMVTERVEPFVKKLRESHPNTSILLAEDPSFLNECPTGKGRILRDAYKKLTAAGDKNLYFLASQDMLGDDSEGTVDGCHPTDLGMMRLADAFVKALRPLLPPLP
jgi:lysophospholipase L1-like esterase